MQYDFKIGWCPFCNQGWAEIVENTESKKLLVQCSECETIWSSPYDFLSKQPRLDTTFFKVIKPEFQKIVIAGWDKYIDKSYLLNSEQKPEVCDAMKMILAIR